mmetsp:Transcript_13036/g.24161  ORF Transcript_13036/g.24161 Transcript_13036/m.24161 type:complete len:305 (+) Transcript_13036:61-975(+)
MVAMIVHFQLLALMLGWIGVAAAVTFTDDGWDDDALISTQSKSKARNSGISGIKKFEWYNQDEITSGGTSATSQVDETKAPWEDDNVDAEQNESIISSETHHRHAMYWSELHKQRPRSIVNSSIGIGLQPRVAVLITGMLRFSDHHHVALVHRATFGSDLFIATYPAYHLLAATLTNNTIFISENELKVERARRGEPQAGMWQWFLLERALSHWHWRLLDLDIYHTIARFRTDLKLPKGFRFSDCVAASSSRGGIVFAQSDTFFYTTPEMMYHVFDSMFSKSRSLYIKNEASTFQEVCGNGIFS